MYKRLALAEIYSAYRDASQECAYSELGWEMRFSFLIEISNCKNRRLPGTECSWVPGRPVHLTWML